MSIFGNTYCVEDDWDEVSIQREMLKDIVHKHINEWDDVETSSDPVFDKFLKLVIPHNWDSKHWLFVQESNEIFIHESFNYFDYINALHAMRDYKANFYFSPVAYKKGRHCDRNALSTNAIYVDIDDVKIDISKYNKEQLITFIKNQYNVPNELLPQFVVKSGHGLHLWFVINTIENSPTRRRYLDNLTTYFGGDVACKSICHLVRVPTSINTKKENIKSELYEINESTDYSIKRLDYFTCTTEQIEQYQKEQNRKRAEKSRLTREKNNMLNASKLPVNPIIEKLDKSPAAMIETSIKANKTINTPNPNVFNLCYSNDYSTKYRYRNLLTDLHNYFIRHQGMIYGYRNNFCFIYSNICKKAGINRLDCFNKLNIYFHDTDFADEMERIINASYNTKKSYKFTNAYIAEMLGFTGEDIKYSHCYYSHDAKSQSQARRNEKRRQERHQHKEQKQKERTEFIKANSHLTNEQLAQKLGVSTRTIIRLKK